MRFCQVLRCRGKAIAFFWIRADQIAEKASRRPTNLTIEGPHQLFWARVELCEKHGQPYARKENARD